MRVKRGSNFISIDEVYLICTWINYVEACANIICVVLE